MRSILSFQSLPGPLWLGVVAPDRVLFMGQIEHLNLSEFSVKLNFSGSSMPIELLLTVKEASDKTFLLAIFFSAIQFSSRGLTED